ncbi:ATP-binding protein [Pimelobacter simplex]|uniref:ATP-binding protein n=1 Tax=Nocardioides simplex TaxID=2045 RepID=UPI003AB06B16
MTAPSSRRLAAFAVVLRGWRESAGLTQAELAERSGVGVRTVSNLERGINTSPYASTVRLLADALGLTEDQRTELLRAARRGVDPADPADPSGEGALPTGGYLGAVPAARLVAREREWAALAEAVGAVGAVPGGRGQVVLLAGEPGIGKTRLAQELALHAAREGFLVATGRCYEPQREMPFAPMLDVAAALQAGARAPERDGVVDRWPPLVTLLPHRLPPVAAAATAPDAAQRLHRAVAGFVRELAAEQPVAILVDDLHWADVATVELLTHLARHTPGDRVLLVGTYRDTEVGLAHPVRRLGRALQREGLVRVVPVRRLEPADTARLITDRLDEAEVAGELSALVHRQTDGNPFFVVETLAALAERGDLARVDGAWVGRGIDELVVPASVSEAIVERVQRLTPATQRVLEAGSVLGEVFDPADLAEEPGLEQALDEAVAAGLLTVEGGRYAFDHSLTRQTLSAGLSPIARRRLHGEVGARLADRPAAVRRRRSTEIARHLEAGGEPGRAVPFLLLAGNVAAGLHSPGDALRHYGHALELAAEVGDEAATAAAREGLGQVQLTTAGYDEAVDHLSRAADEHRRLGDLGARLRAEGLLAQAQYRRGQGEAGAVRLAEVLAGLEQESGPDEHVPGLSALTVGLARVRLALGQRRPSLEAGTRAAALARQEQAVASEADAEALRGTSLLFLDEPDEAVAVLTRSMTLARSVDAPNVESGAILALQWTLTMRGELDRARSMAVRGLEVTRRSGDTDAEALHLANAGLTAFYRGDWDEAQRHLETAMDLARAHARTLFSGIPPAYLGVLRAAQGDVAGAAICFDDAASAPNLLTFEFEAYVEARRAALELEAGNPRTALARLEPWLTVEAPTQIHDVMLLGTAAEACLALGGAADLDRAELLVARAQRRAAATRNVIDGLDADRVQARCLAVRGHREAAARILEETASRARAVPCPAAEARVHDDLARLG